MAVQKVKQNLGNQNHAYSPRSEDEANGEILNLRDSELGVALKTISRIVTQKEVKKTRAGRGLRELEPELTRDQKETVHIQVVFNKIGEIDTAKETFNANIFLQARWREPKYDQQTSVNLQQDEWKKLWNPKLDIDNGMGELKEERWHSINISETDKAAYVVERRRIKGTFLENLELQEFPFDTQELNIKIVSERTTEEVELKLDDDADFVSTINVDEFVDAQEWVLYNAVTTKVDELDKNYQISGSRSSKKDDYKHPRLTATCYVGRNFQFHVWNVLLMEFLLCCMSFNTWSVAQSKPENRLQLTFLLLLTTVTFKTTVTMGMPKIAYLTYLDKYFLVSIGTLCTICVWHAISSFILSSSVHNAFWIDSGILIALGSIYICGNICFILFMVRQQIRERAIYRGYENDMKLLLAEKKAEKKRRDRITSTSSYENSNSPDINSPKFRSISMHVDV